MLKIQMPGAQALDSSISSSPKALCHCQAFLTSFPRSSLCPSLSIALQAALRPRGSKRRVTARRRAMDLRKLVSDGF